MVPLTYYVILSAVVFMIGLVGVLIRRNIVIILLSIELMLNAANINFVAFSHYGQTVTGQVFVFFVMTVAARPGDRDRPLPAARHAQRGRAEPAEMVTGA
jgi:NADH-quinone oxidoreductase subunit K